MDRKELIERLSLLPDDSPAWDEIVRLVQNPID